MADQTQQNIAGRNVPPPPPPAKVRPKPPVAKTGGKKRVVRTQAGASRYHKPVGSEIGPARNQRGAQAQTDTESTRRYRDLISGDRVRQRQAVDKLDDAQLKRLTEVAYSFRSADPKVVQFRVILAGALRRRGLDVNDFGGLGRPTKPRTIKLSAAGPTVSVDLAQLNAKQMKTAVSKGQAMPPLKGSGRPGRFNIRNVGELRDAILAFGRADESTRAKVAKFICKRAKALHAEHMLGPGILKAAGYSPDHKLSSLPVASVELTGKWKHGWIPLDPAAVSAKTRGRKNAKPWWGGKAGSSKSSRRVLSSAETGNRYSARTGKDVPNKEAVAAFDKSYRQAKRAESGPAPVRPKTSQERLRLPSGVEATSTGQSGRMSVKRDGKHVGFLERTGGGQTGHPVSYRAISADNKEVASNQTSRQAALDKLLTNKVNSGGMTNENPLAKKSDSELTAYWSVARRAGDKATVDKINAEFARRDAAAEASRIRQAGAGAAFRRNAENRRAAASRRHK